MKIDTLIFWQPIVSPHFMPIIEACAQYYKVRLYVEKEITDDRRKLGWDIQNSQAVRILNIKQLEKRDLYFANQQTLHIFSGLRGYRLIWQKFNEAKELKANICLMGETQDWMGFKGFLRLLIGYYDVFRLKRYIRFVIAVGDLGVNWYRKIGFDASHIYQWAYAVESYKEPVKLKPISQVNRLLYVGRLEKSKGVKYLLEAIESLPHYITLTIVGTGSLENDIKRYASSTNSRLTFLGQLKRTELPAVYNQHDCLVLPSIRKDGWGAVVNEAMQAGLPVIVTDYCGASVLVKEEWQGRVCNLRKNNESLDQCILEYVNNSSIDIAQRLKIQKFYKTLEPASVAKYFKDVITHEFTKKNNNATRPKAPWYNPFYTRK